MPPTWLTTENKRRREKDACEIDENPGKKPVRTSSADLRNEFEKAIFPKLAIPSKVYASVLPLGRDLTLPKPEIKLCKKIKFLDWDVR